MDRVIIMHLIKKSYYRIRKINLQKPSINNSKQKLKRIYYKPSDKTPIINTNRKSSKHKITLAKLGA